MASTYCLEESEISPDDMSVVRYFIYFKSHLGSPFFGKGGGELLL